MKLRTMALLLLAGTFVGAWAQDSSGQSAQDHAVRQVDAAVYFRIGKSDIDPDFEQNRTNLALFTSALEKVLADSNYVVSRMVVVGTASPDGAESLNTPLAGRRAQALADYLTAHTSLPTNKIEIVNGGENWTGLRLMIETAQNMPYKEQMLALIKIDDRTQRKHKMMTYADGKPWKWMYERFFPDLRKGAGGTQGRPALSRLSSDNWNTLEKLIRHSDLDTALKQKALDAVTNEPDAARRLERLRAIAPDTTVYARLKEALVAGLLADESLLSSDNWALLRGQIAAHTDLPYQKEMLRIIDTTPATRGREQALQQIGGGEPYHRVLNDFLPGLLVAKNRTQPEAPSATAGTSKPVTATTTLGVANWQQLRQIIAASDMPDKAAVLHLIDTEPDLVVREQQLRAIDGGRTSQYINEVFFPELLYGISPASKENWERLALTVSDSDVPHKEEVLKIIAGTSPGMEREQAIRALDGGRSWQRISELMLPELLQSTESVALTGSGMSFSYELSPQVKARAATVARQLAEKEAAAKAAAREAATREAARQRMAEQARQALALRKQTFRPVVALKTDLLLWGSLMPGFKLGAPTLNLSAEVYLARRWSAEAGFAYANWSALSGSKELHAVSTAHLGVRGWLGKPATFRGLFVGLGAGYGQYDVQESPQGQTGTFFSAGVGVGYLLPLSLHWGIEAELRGNYRSAQNEVYDMKKGHYYLNRSEAPGEFAPQLRVQVVYRFGKSKK